MRRHLLSTRLGRYVPARRPIGGGRLSHPRHDSSQSNPPPASGVVLVKAGTIHGLRPVILVHAQFLVRAGTNHRPTQDTSAPRVSGTPSPKTPFVWNRTHRRVAASSAQLDRKQRNCAFHGHSATRNPDRPPNAAFGRKKHCSCYRGPKEFRFSTASHSTYQEST